MKSIKISPWLILTMMLAVFGLAVPAVVRADAGPDKALSAEEARQLRQEVSDLTGLVKKYEERTDKLENLVEAQNANQKELETKLSNFSVSPASGNLPSAPQSPTFLTEKFINVSGYVDTSYNFNFERPKRRSAGNTTLHAFDRDESNFNLNAVKVTMEKQVKEKGVGFRFDLMYGLDSRILTQGGENTDSTGGTVSDELAIEQAYIHMIYPDPFLNRPVDVKVGRFVTLAGFEVIESADNWLSTRSLLFQNAIPYIHTGVRVSYPIIPDKITGTVGLNNGWDQAIDNNLYKTFEAALTVTNIIPKLTNTVVFLGGPEQGSPTTNGDIGNKRNLITVTGIYELTPKISLGGEFDYGNEQNAVGSNTLNTSNWNGVAGYVRYKINDKTALSLRLEDFVDSNAARTGLKQSIMSYAIGLDYWFTQDLLGRLEFRQDHANAKDFIANDLGGVTNNNQQILTGEMIYKF
jgi:hypothetical protein